MTFLFDSSIKEPLAFDRPAWWFVFQGHQLLVRPNSGGNPSAYLPIKAQDVRDNLPSADHIHFLGELGGDPCYVAAIPKDQPLPEAGELEGLGLRRLFDQLPDVHMRLAGRAVQILNWDRNHHYCGRCATETEITRDDRSRVCPNCKLRAYPRLSPAVIMAVLRDDQLLLGRSSRHPNGFYSVLAGFVEPGETLEEAVAREVLEEVGLEVEEITYFGSQPWPFPDSLMIGFICHAKNGEITLTDSEISEAAWYRPDEIPVNRPSAAISIAGQLIDYYIKTA